MAGIYLTFVILRLGRRSLSGDCDQARRQILRILLGGGHTVGEIAANFRMSRPAISKHLRVLRTAGLVRTHKDGAANICDLNAKPLRDVDIWLRDYETLWSESLRGLKRYIEESEDRKEKNS
jgi:DNA-binding transcriptional ArsR family regulator